jgi:uncharacterized protein YcsI (UPF0317 family)
VYGDGRFVANRNLQPLKSAAEQRRRIRAGEFVGPTAEIGLGWLQANLLIIPAASALAFSAFCTRNRRACPVLDTTDPGDPRPLLAASDADLRTDLPRYRVYEHGELVAEPTSIEQWWRDDLVAFLLGCSFTFDQALVDHGISLRHIEQGKNVAMYVTGESCIPAGPVGGPLVVSMRPIARSMVDDVSAICASFPLAHGAPIAAGSPERLGISDLDRPDFGDAVDIRDDEEPVFWACGVTAELAARSAGVDLFITHSPGHMFITDWPAEVARTRGALVGDHLPSSPASVSAVDHPRVRP